MKSISGKVRHLKGMKKKEGYRAVKVVSHRGLFQSFAFPAFFWELDVFTLLSVAVKRRKWFMEEIVRVMFGWSIRNNVKRGKEGKPVWKSCSFFSVFEMF